MNVVSKFLVLSLTFICLEQPAFSIQVVNEARSPSTGMVPIKVVERGGTVDTVNSEKKIIAIDGRSYVLAAAVVVHSASGKDIQGVGSIRPGTKVRFNTTKNNYAAQEQIVEIWISETSKASKAK